MNCGLLSAASTPANRDPRSSSKTTASKPRTEVTVLPLTTVELDAPWLRLPLPVTGTTGLERPSFIMIDKLTTVRRSHVLNYLGRLTSAQMVEVERAILVFLGIAE